MASHDATRWLPMNAVGVSRPSLLRLREHSGLVLTLAFAAAAVLSLEVLRATSFAPAAAAALAIAAFVVVRLTLDVLSARAQSIAFAGLAAILVPALVHVVLAGGRELTVVFAVAGVILALVVLSPHPAATFAGWLFIAPLLQLSARHDPRGYWLNTGLYLAPPLLLVLWTLTPTHARRDRPHPRLLDVFPIAYLLLAYISLAFSAWAKKIGYHTAIDQLYQNIGIGIICYYFCAFGPGRRELAQRFILAFLSSAFLLSILAFVERATGWTMWNTPSDDGRVTATLSQAAVLGAYLGAAIAVATALLLWNGPRPLRRLSVILLPVAIPALGLTLTRGPILATLAVVVPMIALRRSGLRLAAFGAVVLVAAAVIASWGTISSSSLYRDRVVETGNIQGRLLIDQWSIKLFEARPVLGYGYGSFDAIKNAAQLSPGKLPLAAGKDYTSHNTFLTILVEMGAVGLVLLVLPWLKISGEALRAVVGRRSDAPWLLLSCVGIIAAYVLTALTTDMRFFSIVPALPWMALGVIRAQAGLSRTSAGA
jgi:O-antigen ligase